MKNNRSIKYFCYYDSLEPSHPRNCVPSATTKIAYIVSVLNAAGYDVELVSAAPVTDLHFNLSWGGSTRINEHVTVRHFVSYGCLSNKILRKISNYLTQIHLFIWALVNVARYEQIIVYHSLGYCALLYWLSKIKGCSIIGEVEEIYQDVHKQSARVENNEYRFFHQCKKFLFPTELLNLKLNISGKPSAIVHGIYSLEKKLGVSFHDDMIHVVYAGTLDPKKGGAVVATRSAEFLPANYHLHICGFGDSVEVENICKEINLKGKGKVTFEGMLRGADFTKMIQKCSIGLSTQDPSAAFNNTSFPSKILTYFSNGLKVVTVRIPVVESSGVGDSVFYYSEQNPKLIAAAIMEASKSNKGSVTSKLVKLDKEFRVALLNLL